MVYDNIKRLADEKNIRIVSLESKAGLGRGTIGKWRRQTPQLRNLVRVAQALDVPIEELVSTETTKPF